MIFLRLRHLFRILWEIVVFAWVTRRLVAPLVAILLVLLMVFISGVQVVVPYAVYTLF